MLHLSIALLVGRRRRRGGEGEIIALIYQKDLSAAVPYCCCTSYLAFNKLPESLSQQINKSVIPHSGHTHSATALGALNERQTRQGEARDRVINGSSKD